MHHQVRLDLREAKVEATLQPLHDEGSHHRLSLWAYYPGAHVTHCDLLASLDQLDEIARAIAAYAEARRGSRRVPETLPLAQRLTDLAHLAELFGEAIETYAAELQQLSRPEAESLRQAGRLYAQHVIPAFRQAALAVQEVAS